MATFLANGGVELALGMVVFIYVAVRAFVEDWKYHGEKKLIKN